MQFDPQITVKPEGVEGGVCEYVDWLFYSFLSQAPCIMVAEDFGKDPMVKWEVSDHNYNHSQIIETTPVLYFRSVLARIAAQFMEGALYGGFLRFRIESQGNTYSASFYMGNDSLNGFWFRGAVGAPMPNKVTAPNPA